MNSKAKKAKKQAVINNSTANILSKEELTRRIAMLQESMKAATWRELETNGKFTKNDKLTFIRDDMLIIGCDIGSEMHYVRAIDSRGRELSQDAFPFSNSSEGFQSAKAWAFELAAANDKHQIVLGLEPTGHYWFCLAAWMVSNDISELIANLVKDGNYGMPYLPEGLYADLRRLSMLRDQLTEDRTRNTNRLHREMKIYFPEYRDAFGKVDGSFTLEILKAAPFPEDIVKLGVDGLKDIWHSAKLRGRGYSRAEQIVRYAEGSVGLKHGTAGGRKAVKIFAEQMKSLSETLEEIEAELHQKCLEIPYAENILEIRGIGENILAGILAEMGDITRFDDVSELQKLSGLGLVACSSGKHKGETKISHRGRKHLRYWLFQAAKSAVSHGEEFQELHAYYTTRKENPLKKMQSLIVIACKILRIIFTMLRTGCRYDPAKMLRDIKRPRRAAAQAA